MTLSGGLLMMTGLTVVKSGLSTLDPAYLFSSIAGGTVVMVFIAFLFGSGARKHLKFILPVPLIIQVAYVTSVYGLDWKEVTFFINPFITALGVVILVEYQEKLAYNEYKQRLTVEAQRQLLQHEIEERKVLQNKLYEKTIKDELTGAYNRRMLFTFLDRQMGISKTKNENLSLCYIDLDGFKKFNDEKGHLEGDLLIQKFFLVLKGSIRDTDIICRVGGDEFIVIFPNCQIEQAGKIISRAKEEVDNTMAKNGINISFSYGFSEYTLSSDMTVTDLIDQADRAMYIMKKEVICGRV